MSRTKTEFTQTHNPDRINADGIRFAPEPRHRRPYDHTRRLRCVCDDHRHDPEAARIKKASVKPKKGMKG